MAPNTFDRRKTKIREWEQELTPLEIAELLKDDADLPFTIAPLLRSGQKPAAYIREMWGEDATFFTSRGGAGRLIVIFAAPRPRRGIPISYVLQALRDDANDVIWLQDPSQLHYTGGIRGLGSFLEIVQRIELFATGGRYQQIITFGVSLGGLPALRAGQLLRATRAVSVGGRYPWHPGRLIRKERSVQAFDPLCPCASPSPTELLLVYSQHNEEDRRAFNLVRKTFPECIAAPIDTEKHNLMGHFYKANLLPTFLACLFEYWDAVEIRTDLLQRLNQARQQNEAAHTPPVARTSRPSSNRTFNPRLVRLRDWAKQYLRSALR
jgi:hypothetical protein